MLLSREGKRRRLIRGYFCEEVLSQEDNAEGSRELQKGESGGQRVRERWNKRTDNRPSKNIGAKKSLCAYLLPGRSAFVLGARKISLPPKSGTLPALQEPILYHS